MDIKFARIDRALSLRAQIPLSLENGSPHEVDGHFENASWDAIACTTPFALHCQHQSVRTSTHVRTATQVQHACKTSADKSASQCPLHGQYLPGTAGKVA